jgi:threonine aldolase
MTHDYTYLNQLPVTDLLDRAHRDNWSGPEAHMIRALAQQLEDHLDAVNEYDAVNDALMEANQLIVTLQTDLDDATRRANGWQEEAQAVQRQLDQVRG